MDQNRLPVLLNVLPELLSLPSLRRTQHFRCVHFGQKHQSRLFVFSRLRDDSPRGKIRNF